MTSITTTDHPPGTIRAAPFRATLASEWTKMWTLPFTRRMLLFAVVISAAAAAVFTLTTAVTEGTALADMAPIDAAGASLLGADLAVIVLAILAASNVASEYTTGMIRVTLATTPRRWRPLTAKATAPRAPRWPAERSRHWRPMASAASCCSPRACPHFPWVTRNCCS